MRNERLHEAALEHYNARITQLVIDLRTQISRARYLASEDVAKEIETFLNETIFKVQDNMINEYVQKHATDGEWTELHTKFTNVVYPKAKVLVSDLVKSLKIDKPD